MKKIIYLILFSILLISCSKYSTSLLEKTQNEIIIHAIKAISLLPDIPHERTRNRELSSLISLLIQNEELDKINLYLDRITDWRKPKLTANLALANLKNGNKKIAEELINEVQILVETIEGLKSGKIFATGEYKDLVETYDDFRLDRVKVAIAQYYWFFGDEENAIKWSQNVLATEKADFIKEQAESLSTTDYKSSLSINNILANGETFEGKKAAIDGYVLLYNLYYQDDEKRTQLEELIDKFESSMPVMFRIEWLHSMAISAHSFGDYDKAIDYYTEASLWIADSSFRPRLFFPLKSSNIITAKKIGLVEDARDSAILLHNEYDRVEESIYNIHRADVLCAIAECFIILEDFNKSEELYCNAFFQSEKNPNSKPRVEDLTIIISSLIKNEVEISSNLTYVMTEFIDRLGVPW